MHGRSLQTPPLLAPEEAPDWRRTAACTGAAPPPPGEAERPPLGAQHGSPDVEKDKRTEVSFPFCRKTLGWVRGEVAPLSSTGEQALLGHPALRSSKRTRYRTRLSERRSFSLSKAETHFLLPCGCVQLAGSLQAADLPTEERETNGHTAPPPACPFIHPLACLPHARACRVLGIRW